MWSQAAMGLAANYQWPVTAWSGANSVHIRYSAPRKSQQYMTVKQTQTDTGLVEITTDPLEAEETVFAITATQFWAATSRAKVEGGH